MRTLALPIRISRDGQLERGDGTEQLVRLVQAMAAATPGSWPHAPWFGLQPLFLEANLALQDQQTLADAINGALQELGVHWARVVAMRTAPGLQYGERRFDITLAVDDGPAVHGTLSA